MATHLFLNYFSKNLHLCYMFCFFVFFNSVLVNKGERLSGASPEFVLIPDNFFFCQILPIFAAQALESYFFDALNVCSWQE